jgi:hypothetical protein
LHVPAREGFVALSCNCLEVVAVQEEDAHTSKCRHGQARSPDSIRP